MLPPGRRGRAASRDRVGAADEQVAGVEAERRRRCRRGRARTSSPVSTMVPTCGCSVAVTPTSAATAASRSRLGSRRAQPSSSSTGRSSYPSRPVAAASTSVRHPPRRRPPERSDGGHRVVSRVVQDHRDEPAHGVQPVLGQHLRPAPPGRREEALRPELGCGQAQLAHLPRGRWRRRTATPSPGTSQTPHEMGAAAMRSANGRLMTRPSTVSTQLVVHAPDLSGRRAAGCPRPVQSGTGRPRLSTICSDIRTLRHECGSVTIGHACRASRSDRPREPGAALPPARRAALRRHRHRDAQPGRPLRERARARRAAGPVPARPCAGPSPSWSPRACWCAGAASARPSPSRWCTAGPSSPASTRTWRARVASPAPRCSASTPTPRTSARPRRSGSPDTPLVAMVRVRYAGDAPLAVLRNWLPPQFADLTREQLQADGLYALLRARGVRPAVARQTHRRPQRGRGGPAAPAPAQGRAAADDDPAARTTPTASRSSSATTATAPSTTPSTSRSTSAEGGRPGVAEVPTQPGREVARPRPGPRPGAGSCAAERRPSSWSSSWSSCSMLTAMSGSTVASARRNSVHHVDVVAAADGHEVPGGVLRPAAQGVGAAEGDGAGLVRVDPAEPVVEHAVDAWPPR